MSKNAPSRNNKLHANNSASQNVGVSVSESLYAGALPHPEHLRQFNDIIPNGADRIMAMAENDQIHQINFQHKQLLVRDKIITNEHKEILIGQIFAFVLCLISLLGGIYLLSINNLVGLILSGVPLAGVINTLITRGKTKK